MKTVLVKVRVYGPENTLTAGITVTARLQTVGITPAGMGFVDRTFESAVTDVLGECELQLWPSIEGTTGAEYQIVARNHDGSKLFDELVSVPDVDFPIWLHDIILLPPPSTKYYDVEAIKVIIDAKVNAMHARDEAVQAALDAQEAVGAAELAAASAATSADDSAASAAAAALSANAAAASAVAAKASEDAAKATADQFAGEIGAFDSRVTAVEGRVTTLEEDVLALQNSGYDNFSDLANLLLQAETEESMRGILELGTAATKDTQTSAYDATASRLLEVGAFGLGGTTLDTLTDPKTQRTGFYQLESKDVGPNADGVNVTRYRIIHILDGENISQIWISSKGMYQYDGTKTSIGGGFPPAESFETAVDLTGIYTRLDAVEDKADQALDQIANLVIPNVTISLDDPVDSEGVDGNIWIKYKV